MPPRRTKIITLLIAIGLAITFGLAWLLSPRLIWDGAAVRSVHLTLVDDRTSLPIVGAAVLHKGRAAGTTDEKGQCQWLGAFGAGGEKTIFGRTGSWAVGGELRVVTSEGRSYTFDLRDLVRDVRRRLSDDGPVQAVVRLSST